MNEEELLEQARRGENAARTELVMRHGRQLFGLAAALLGGGDADVNDVVQETFLAAFDGGLKAFQGGSSLSTWLSGVMINRVRKLRRYRQSRPAGPLDGIERQPAADDQASRSHNARTVANRPIPTNPVSVNSARNTLCCTKGRTFSSG